MRIIYIAGYGRSGSTILDIVLSNDSRIIGLGEFTNIFSFLAKNRDKVGIWYDLKNHLELEDKELLRLDRNRKIFESFCFGFVFKSIKRSAYKEYIAFTRIIFSFLKKKFNKTIFIDSSKTAWMQYSRPKILEKIFSDVRVIHLDREFKSVYASLKKGDNIKMENMESDIRIRHPLLKLIIGKTLSKIYHIKNIHSDKYLYLSFEEFKDQPLETLDQISMFIDSPLDEVIKKISNGMALSQSYQFSGNRTRNNKDIFFNQE